MAKKFLDLVAYPTIQTIVVEYVTGSDVSNTTAWGLLSSLPSTRFFLAVL
jgi:hypothetical protein